MKCVLSGASFYMVLLSSVVAKPFYKENASRCIALPDQFLDNNIGVGDTRDVVRVRDALLFL